jgi:repressor LexA
MELSGRQKAILEFIEEAIGSQGYPPTVREIGAAVGLASPASVHNHLEALENKGFIRRGAAKRRALEVVRSLRAPEAGDGDGSVGIPLVGKVAAGVPILAVESAEDVIHVPEFLGEADGCFALRVTGDSMIKAGILHGDVVVVKQQDTADDGDIVVAMLGEEATLKRFFREADQVRLQPENDGMSPIYTRHPRILGRVTGVLRRL